MASWSGIGSGHVNFHIPASHFHNHGAKVSYAPIERSHPVVTPVAGTTGFTLKFQRLNGIQADIRMFPHDSVQTLQRKIYAETSVHPHEQHLSYNGQRLAGGVLRDYGIGADSAVVQGKDEPSLLSTGLSGKVGSLSSPTRLSQANQTFASPPPTLSYGAADGTPPLQLPYLPTSPPLNATPAGAGYSPPLSDVYYSSSWQKTQSPGSAAVSPGGTPGRSSGLELPR
jgi:hypothetical protein